MKPVRDVLYVVSSAIRATVRAEMAAVGGQVAAGPTIGEWTVLQGEDTTFRFLLTEEVLGALKLLADHYFNFVVVDGRGGPGIAKAEDDPTPLTVELLQKIHYSGDPDQRYPLSRLIAVLDDDENLSAHAFELGKLRIGAFLARPFEKEGLVHLLERLYDPDPGRTAICLSGGGLEGFLYELGVLLAINAHLQTSSVTDFDIYCGISAGSILAAFLANGTPPEEIVDAVTAPRGKAKVDPLTPGVIYDVHLAEYFKRIWGLGKALPTHRWSEMTSNLLKTVPSGFFRGDSLQEFVRKQLNEAGRTDDFRQLKHELYIGATDQDTSSHVVFGDGQWRDIPISSAVRASTALTPFFGPAKIRGRYFVDGQYTRTSNFHLAVERGAKLVIVIDPLVPIRVDVPGYVRDRGGVFGALQALKAVIHTRFMQGFQAAVDNYPEVDFVLFKPEGEVTRVMSGSPMKYNIRTEIINMAFRQGVQRLQHDYEVLRGTFARHGFVLQRHPRLRMAHQEVS